jgi:hypothetical protein
MENVNMVEYLVGLQKHEGVKVFLTEDGLKVFLELMKTQNNGSGTAQKVG